MNRDLIVAALCDLVANLNDLPNPIVVGSGYPRTKLLDAFTSWCRKRGINHLEPASEEWLGLCNKGFMRNPKGGVSNAESSE